MFVVPKLRAFRLYTLNFATTVGAMAIVRVGSLHCILLPHWLNPHKKNRRFHELLATITQEGRGLMGCGSYLR